MSKRPNGVEADAPNGAKAGPAKKQKVEEVKEEREKTALITGITGQDGSYLAELLLSKNYIVHGIIRRSSSFNTGRLTHMYKDQHADDVRLILHYGDLSDGMNLVDIMKKCMPDEVYNLAAQSHVKVSFESPEYTSDIDALGTLRLLDAIRAVGLTKSVRFYQASTSELFGKVRETPQSETTPFYPRSPYAVAKQFAYWMVVNYREAYGIHASNGILFNHESPRRGPTFVTRKITRAVSRISKKIQKCLYLGNLNSKRDWGHAKDYVEGMWRMLQQPTPDDFVLSTNETNTVRKFVELAFEHVNEKISWEGEGTDEVGKNKAGEIVVRVDPKYFRPTEVDLLLGDNSKAKRLLKWSPTTTFEELVTGMMNADLAECETTHLKW
mmetsp:Transcript_10057/g.11448  ORF Transcript_10057/g.11448 Transcript_10057/m.11448 type:complete len:383 (+) Transcript_10057:19-1167(+)|eukprot:CAMPEP_0205832534 /NCGR_PEP_ID=MMETSP0206-20130828/47179_1 /ASSEMBLY_ACC=CAM_ASM_000279 /TAXON_ID=36767 /ORGANISM="Euplotes focardii, Strain TN1" /LENGTH=382 /DNA_ID=CAMNT_0053138145 /DNA_START=15 /DNA_END=1163 /DNA_ORIENTATION=-